MVCFSSELWCPTCGVTTDDGKDCAKCEAWWKDSFPDHDKRCTCMEVYGEDPACVVHGRGTKWAEENLDDLA